MDEMGKMKTAVVTGAAGFAGFSLVVNLLKHEYNVYAIVRPNSQHNERLKNTNINRIASIKSSLIDEKLRVVEVDASDYIQLPEKIHDKCDVFFHLSWSGKRDDFEEQQKNIDWCINTVEAAKKLGCSKFICTGSQAEYGVKQGIITEDLFPEPINAYGAAKLAALYLTKRKAEQLGLDWIWARIFSLYGLYEPPGRMLPDLINSLARGEKVYLTDCSQYWDYLEVEDAAEALIALAEKGNSGEIYNVANGAYRPLREYVELMRKFSKGGQIVYGDKATPYISLRPSIDKINTHTGWKPKHQFLDNYVLMNQI